MECGRDVLAILRGYEERARALFGRLAALGDYAEEYTDVLAGLGVLLTGHVAVADTDVYPVLRDARRLPSAAASPPNWPTPRQAAPHRAGRRSFWRFGPLRQAG